MKKLNLTCLILVLSIYSFAQGISGGVKAGLNLANQKFSGDGVSVDTKLKPGLHVGGFVTIMVNEKFGIQPEVLFSMQGSNWDVPSYDVKYNFNYLIIPVLFRYNINEMISLHAGPQVGLLLSAEADYDGDTEDIKDELKSMDIGGAIGLEVDLPMGLGFGARFVQGFSQIADTEDPDDDFELKNSAIQVYLKYKLFGKDQ